MASRLWTGAALALLSLSLAGCGTSLLNTARGERKIAGLVLQRTGEKVAVSCPHDVPLRDGERTTCEIKGRDGSTATATMVQTDDKGNVHVSSRLMATAVVERKVARDASRKLGFPVTIDCPDVVDLPGEIHIRCTAADRNGRTEVTYVTIAADGSATYRIPPRP